MNGGAQRWVIVARILRPRGNKGEVAAVILTDFPERLTEIHEVYVGEAGGDAPARRMSVQSCWLSQNHRGQIVFLFEGCSSIGDAEKLRGLDVLLPLEQRVSLPAGKYFVSDLVGCSVFQLQPESGALASTPCSLAEAPVFLGKVIEVQFVGEQVAGTPMLAVETSDGEVLIPLAEDICKRIDPVARRIEVALPEGLLEINRE